MVVMLVKKGILLRPVRFGFQTKIFGLANLLIRWMLKDGQLQEDRVLQPIVVESPYLEVISDLVMVLVFKEH